MKRKFLFATIIIVTAVGILAACTQPTANTTQETQSIETEAVQAEPEETQTEESEAVETQVDESPTEETLTTEKSEAEVLIDERCSKCHSASKVYSETLTQEEWDEVFDDMIAKGAEVSDAEKTMMIEWLVSGN